MPAKYIFENGIMKLNPAYNQGGQQPAAPRGNANETLEIISSTSDYMDANEAHGDATGGVDMRLPEATIESMQKLQNANPDAALLDNLTHYFERYEIPLGLVTKLLALANYKLNFIIDDSGSMLNDSDASIKQAHLCTKQTHDPFGNRAQANALMTRWEEAEDRLHIMLDVLAYIPTKGITLSFLNRAERVDLPQQGLTPERFAETAHQRIRALFNQRPAGQTPIYGKLSRAFTEARGNTMHYLLTDGVPSDRPIEEVKKLVLNRPNPQANPLTFLSCTDNDEEAEWMKEIEGLAPFTAELDDFTSEKQEVVDGQGSVFPFTRGMWLICNLVAAINPDDLDALDEPTPFTKGTLDNLLGRQHTEQEYRHYFDHHPKAAENRALYNQFAREDIAARQVIAQAQGARR